MAGLLAGGAALLLLIGSGEAGAGLSSPAMDEDGTFVVSWSGIDCSRRCRLTQSRDGGAFSEVSNVGPDSHTINLGSSPTAGNYAYRIATCRALSRLGGEVCLPFPLHGPWTTTTVVGAPAAPTLTLTKGRAERRHRLSWTASAGTTEYRLHKRGPNGGWRSIYEGPDRAKAIANADMGTH